MPQTRILPRSSVLSVLGSQVYKEHSLWQNRAYRAPGTIDTTQVPAFDRIFQWPCFPPSDS